MGPRHGCVVPLVLLLGGCGGDAGSDESTGLPEGDEPVQLDPADFTLDITNPYWPMKPGDRWVFRISDREGSVQRDEITVLDETRTVDGIEARVVHDVQTREDGTVVEDAIDWFAQDSAGNIWYLGEQTEEAEDGEEATTEGSWEAAVDHAQPGIMIPAEPEPGLEYRQEYRPDEAEDRAVVLSTSEQVESPAGTYGDALLTRDTTPLEPELVELRFYAPGIGPVLTLQSSGGTERKELVETTRTG